MSIENEVVQPKAQAAAAPEKASEIAAVHARIGTVEQRLENEAKQLWDAIEALEKKLAHAL